MKNPRISRAIKKLGRDFKDARLRRRLPMSLVAERAGISVKTLGNIENGDTGVSIGNVAAAIFALGMRTPFEEVLDLKNYTLGRLLDLERIPKRARIPQKIPNEVGGRMTTAPEKVRQEMATLIKRYGRSANKSLEDILAFHVAFERIHPFQDVNGRVGRLIMLKECLRCGITPFIVGDDLKLYYYRGLSEWDDMPGYLIDTCLTAQDRFKKILDYFKVAC